MNMEQVSSHNEFIKGFTQLLRDIKPVIVSSSVDLCHQYIWDQMLQGHYQF